VCIQRVPRRRPDQLSHEHADHIRRVDPVARFRRYGIDGRAIRDLAGLQHDIEHERLKHGASNRVRDGVCADDDAREAEELADDDAEEGDESIDHEAGKGRAEGHAEDADKGEEADDEVGV